MAFIETMQTKRVSDFGFDFLKILKNIKPQEKNSDTKQNIENNRLCWHIVFVR